MCEEDYYEGQLNVQYVQYLREKKAKEQDKYVREQEDEFWRHAALSELKEDE